DEPGGAVGILGQEVANDAQGHEPLFLQALDQAHALDEGRRIVGHVARGPHDLTVVAEQPFSKVVLDGSSADARALRELGDLEHALRSQRPHPLRKEPSTAPAGPATAPASWRAAISSRLNPAAESTSSVCSPSPGPGARTGSAGVRASLKGGPSSRTGLATPGWSSSTTRSRAATCSEARASPISRTGSRQQSCSAANARHCSRVRPAKISLTARWVSEPGGSKARSSRSSRPTPRQKALQNLG